MKYSVGQILYVVLNKKNQVYPMQVVEIITKRTLSGEAIQYLLQGGLDSSTTILLENVDGEIYESAEEVKETLTHRATTQIAKIVALAERKSQEWYSSPSEEIKSAQPQQASPTQEIPVNDRTVPVRLSDGTIANVKLPDGSSSEVLI